MGRFVVSEPRTEEVGREDVERDQRLGCNGTRRVPSSNSIPERNDTF